MLPDPDLWAEDQPGLRARTIGSNKDKDNDDDQGGDIPEWMFQKAKKEEIKKCAQKKRDSKKKPTKHKENDNHARQEVKVNGGATKEECVARQVVMRAQVKKSDKVNPLKVKDAMSRVDYSTTANFHQKDLTLKKCFDRVGMPIIRENYIGDFYMKNGLL